MLGLRNPGKKERKKMSPMKYVKKSWNSCCMSLPVLKTKKNQNQNTTTKTNDCCSCVFFIHVLCFFLCVLFYFFFICGACTGTAQIGISLVSLFDPLFKRSRLNCLDVCLTWCLLFFKKYDDYTYTPPVWLYTLNTQVRHHTHLVNTV